MALRTLIAFSTAAAAVIVIAILSYTSLNSTSTSARNLTRTIAVMAQLQTVISTLKDAETGQRGYLLTGREPYLEPFAGARGALATEFAALDALTADNPVQHQRLDELRHLAYEKMDELGETVALRRAGEATQAQALVLTDRGKVLMDRIRAAAEQMEGSENQLIGTRTAEWQNAAARTFLVTGAGSAVLMLLIAVAALLSAREYRARQLTTWLRNGQMGLSDLLQGDQPLDKLGQQALTFLADYLGAQVGALLIAEGNQFRRVAGFALPDANLDTIRPGDGLAGEVARSNRPLRVRDVPPGYMSVGSAVGGGAPGELLIAPASMGRRVQAIVELGFFGAVDDAYLLLLERVSEPIFVAVRAARERTRLEELLEETQRQAAELQTREEELRVNNEELEEQGRSLKESRAQLESQQAELEQINTQLEEQAQVLEHQRDELSRSHAALTERSVELQRANDYKSEFLANMSHELRTPLNSTLILAKLLADNKEGNLTEKQVRFAKTISGAGNDLLTLINDVLDLSRIEAGKVDLSAETVPLSSLLETLTTLFQPAAEQKNLAFSTSLAPGIERLETDPQRLGQILRNLLSNALKFTERGTVSLRVAAVGADRVAFAVRDTGVGIADNQQGVIFEAFRQADGSIHRKFGGTGLGLSISRDLARLLGGTLSVQSRVGEGSEFTLTLPLKLANPPAIAPTPALAAPMPGAIAPPTGAPRRAAAPLVEDDRHALDAAARLILVIEDDVPFALILKDLVHEMGFQCVVTHSANDGLAAANEFLPSAILLDINLPDHSGLGVLDQLKRDARTRHIPVHVSSVADYRREAMELGAVGYALKPVKREELIDAVRRLELRLSQGLRRVLVVEDDARQRESIRQLLSNGNVEIKAVPNAADALRNLKEATFDCMVMDFNLPDCSGYDLLEQMAQQEDVAFPPVIVYTGRALSIDEEQRLRRYSKSIIIKDARSPERLLDEVTLFLHQVESKLPPERQQMLKAARSRDTSLEGRRVLIVEDDVRNIFALSSVLEPKGVTIDIARNGIEALNLLDKCTSGNNGVDLVLMDIMMPEMDGFTAMREIRKRPGWKNLPIIALTAKAMKDDQERCLAAGANDYIAKPLDVEKLLSLVRVWMPK